MTKQAIRKPCPSCGTKDSQHADNCDFGADKEQVHNPLHYGGRDNPYEVIKVLEAWLSPAAFEGFLVGNTIKYQARAPKKGGMQDMEKAKWYSDYLVDWRKRTGG